MQLGLSKIFIDYQLVEAWGLPPLSTTVGDEVEKPVRRNWFFSFVIKRQLPH